MKNILFKAFEEDGQRIYVYELPEEAELDEDTLDLCEDGALKGLVSMEYVDDADAFYYDVTGYKTLAKAVSGEVDSSDVLEALYGLAKVLVELKENNVPLSYLLLHKDFIFIDRMTMEMKFICVPLEEERASNAMEDVARFIRTLLASLKYDISENGTYVTKMVALANTPEQFNVSILVNVLQDLMSEYGVPYDDIEVPETYADYDDEGIGVIDTSVLEGMPESVSVADMEAAALRDEAARMTAEAEEEETEEYTDDTEMEATEEYAEDVETVEEEAVEEYAEDAETVEEEAVEEYAEDTETVEEEAVEEYAEDTETVEEEDVEEYVEDTEAVEEEVPEATEEESTEGLTQEIGEAYSEAAEEEFHEQPAPAAKQEKIWDDETKRKQQEALRRIAEAEKLKSYGNKSLNLNIDDDAVDDEVDAMVAKIEAEAEAETETEYGNTQILAPKKKAHKLELAKETIVRPVFDSVFEPIIESIDGPIEGDEVPKPHAAPAAKPAKTAVKPAKASKAKVKAETKADAKVTLEEDEGASILSQEVSAAAEPSLISQLDSRADTLPKVNPYLIRVNNEERIMITKANFKIGKASFGMDYQVTDNGAISRNHCLIFAKDGVYYIRDNKSTNHTYVNGQIVKNGQDVLLTHESTIRIADEDFLFKLR